MNNTGKVEPKLARKTPTHALPGGSVPSLRMVIMLETLL
jgi:hypothetical protein